MTTQSPRVSIGLPVYNGENFLRQSVDSVIAQTFTDWELVISDNCSNDATESICRQYAASDPRIRYFRQPKNLGGLPNHNKTLELARGEYFKLYAHDDMLKPTYLERLVPILDQDPSIVLAHSKVMIIDAHGREVGPDPWHLRTWSDDARVRFQDVVWKSHHCFQIYGLMRRSLTPMQGLHASSDQRLLAEMSLKGRFYEWDEYLALNRRHEQQSVSTLPAYMRGKRRTFFGRVGQLPHLGWADTSKEGKISFPMWRIIREYTLAIGRSPADWSVKLWCWGSIVLFFFASWHRLGRDILVALDQLIQQTRWAEGIARRRSQAANLMDPRGQAKLPSGE